MSLAGLTLRAFPRIHITLIDLGHATLRANGGAGFTLDCLPIEISVHRCSRDQLVTPDDFDCVARADVEVALNRLRDVWEFPATAIRIITSAPQHVGLGTKTAAVLGTLRAVASLYGITITPTELQTLSARGGTSGVGISTFFTGGFVADSGQPAVADQFYKPSSAAGPSILPVPIVHMGMPTVWNCHLILPPGTRVAGADEAAFFQNNTPIPDVEVLQVLAAVYHGICPGVASASLSLFRRASVRIHETGFKRREVAAQPPEVGALLRRVNENPTVSAGMSSMGPLLYVIGMLDHSRKIRGALEDLCALFGASYIGAYRFRNAGFEIDR